MRFLIAAATILLCSQAGYALKPFLYTQDFETDNPVQQEPWAVGAKYNIHYNGLTDEKAYSGKQSYKIDVTIENGNYVYFGIPVRIPVQGKLRFSAYIFIPEDSQGYAGVGFDYVFPPTPHTGCIPLGGETFTQTNGQWKRIEGDINTDAIRSAKDVVPRYIWGIDSDQLAVQLGTSKSPVGIWVDKIGIFLTGQGRHIMYLDDIRIEGQAPDPEEFEAAYKAQWAQIEQKTMQKKQSWLNALERLQASLSSMEELSGDAASLRKDLLEYMATVRARVDSTLSTPYLQLTDQTFIDAAMKQIVSMRDYVKELASGKIKLSDMRISIVVPVSSNKILPKDIYIPGKISDTVSLAACPAEITAASFVVRPTKNLAALQPVATDLKSGKNTIKSSAIDIKLVKCWYQAGSAWQNIGQDKNHRFLVPELLLNDDSLIKVDYEKQENYLKCSFSHGERYLWISDTTSPQDDTINHTIEEYPVRDARTLQPISLDAGVNQQYWVTFKVPANAKPGTYSGQIKMMDGNLNKAVIKVKLNVLPFVLDPPYYTSSIYYRGILREGWERGSIGSEYKSEQQLFAELKDLIDHGVDSPTVYQPADSQQLLGKYLSIFRRAGWKGKSVYFLGTSVGAFKFTTPEGLEQFKKSCSDAKQFMKKYGVENLYVYGIDEATGELLASQRKAFAAAHDAGVKLFVAGYDGTFEAVGDLLDILVYAGTPNKAQAAKWHSVKHKIWSYANPQGGVENPEVYRRNFGLLLWNRNFDGACTYAYQHAFGSIWNDFDNPVYRDHNMTYPTVDGVIDTIQWEGYREGVNDIKYLTTLLNAINRAKSKGKNTAAKAAEKYLDSIDVVNGDLDQIRAGMVKHIIALKK